MGKLRIHTGKPDPDKRLKKIPTKSTKWKRRLYVSLTLNITLLTILFFLIK